MKSAARVILVSLAVCLSMGMGAAGAFAADSLQQQSISDYALAASDDAALTTSAVSSKTTGLYKVGGKWRYYEKGKFAKKTGLVRCVKPGSNYGKWYYVKDGKFAKKTGLVKGIQGNRKGKWYYVKNGKFTKKTGLVKCIQGSAKGKWFHVKNGKKTTFTGLVRKSANSSKWYYVKNGKHAHYTGAVYQNGKYYYVRKGIKDKKYRGHIKIYGSTYKVRNGICTYDRYRNLSYPDNYVSYGPHCVVEHSGGAVLRYGPSAKYSVKKRVANGSTLVECGYNSNTGWLYVRDTDYNYGWVKTKHVHFYGGMAKPAIYLYPQKPTDVAVSVDLSEGQLTNTIPEYGAGWNVTAYPDGKIVDKADGSVHPYLFWESDSKPSYDWSEGYVVEGVSTEEFLTAILPEMGLSPQETADFVEFWAGRMEGNAYNLITFQTDCYTDVAGLNIDPEPDSLLRVFMAYKALDKPIAIKAPAVNGFDRIGFTVVEWGGTEVL